ncbi:MAG: hypothetical protein ACTSRP_27620, partial [Candidatus Helarchaeota archaeon]
MNKKIIKINIKHLIEFFDEKPSDSIKHATAITQLAGEDLNAGIFKHYLENEKQAKVEIYYDLSVTTGNLKGRRLDRWIGVFEQNKKTLFQTEIKSWSSHAIGVKKILKIDASKEEIEDYKITMWKGQWDEKIKLPYRDDVRKVIIPMRIPDEIKPKFSSNEQQPLVIYWAPIHPEGKDEPFFDVKIDGSNKFQKIYFFSVSSYLRKLLKEKGIDTLQIEMPNVYVRIKWINKIFSII